MIYMGILYLISTLILLIAFILMKKSDKEINVISIFTISIVSLFCYNTFICYILTFFDIPIKLWLLSLINILISGIIGILILKKKEIQKYIFYKTDILYISLMAVVVLVILYINFGIPFNIKYETSDPAVHYLTSVKFAESDSLLPGAEEDPVYGSFKARKTVSYVNSGLLMKCLYPDLEPMKCYNVFVVFGALTLFLTGVAIYSAMLQFVLKKEHRFWAFIISLICMLGYPLNSFLFGFEYMSMGLLIICSILDMIKYYENETLNIRTFIGIMFLLNFGLFSSYYLFVPYVYSALGIAFYIKEYKSTKKIVNKNVIVLWIITLIIPFLLGYIYHLEPQIYGVICNNDLELELGQYSGNKLNSHFAENGYIYINIYSNILLLLPLPIILILKKARKKDINFIELVLLFIYMFLVVLFIGYNKGKVSIYYISKNYFALWIFLLYYNYQALIEIAEENKNIPRILITTYAFLMIICTIFSDVKMIDDVLTNEDENIFSVMEIFGSNKTMLFKEKEKLNQHEIDILMYARKNLDYNSKIEVVTEGIQYYWSYVLLRYCNYEPVMDRIEYGQYKLNLKVYYLYNKINNVDYMIYFNRSQKYNQLKDRLFANSEIIYENEAGGILKYIK